MKILGEWNWYLPRWLEWLPTLAPDGDGSAAMEPTTQSPGALLPR